MIYRLDTIDDYKSRYLKMKTYLILLFLFVSVLTTAQDKKLESMFKPFKIEFVEHYAWNNNVLSITAKPNTNLFITHTKNWRATNLPMLLMEPESNFMLQAKVETNHINKWDAGILVVYVNDDYWGKLCFEKTMQGVNRMVTVINNQVSDDASSVIVEEDEVYVRLVKMGQSFRYSFSLDGEIWQTVRYFTLNKQNAIKVGFASQSAGNESCISTFRQIEYRTSNIQEYWKNKM